jgi:PAS domain S-box-containing protein
MNSAPLPADEKQRLAALIGYEILDTAQEVEFDDFTRLASQICGTPIALISLLDAERQWFKSKVGLDVSETPRELAFCAHAVLGEGVMEVPNALEDPRFSDNPLVAGAPDIRFYAGMPLTTPGGHNLGTLCVIDRVPRNLSAEQLEALACLGRQVVAQLELRRANREIQQQMELLESLGQSSRRLAAIVDSSGDAILSKTLDGVVTSWNTAAQRMFGYTEQEMIGAPMLKLFPPDRMDEEYGILARIRAGERIEHFETVRVRKDGTLLQVSATISPIKDAAGRIIGASKIVRDITQQKQAEESLNRLNQSLQRQSLEIEEANRELKRSNDDLAQFASVVSHDLREPLRMVSSFVQLLEQRLKGRLDAETTEMIGFTISGARKMKKLIDDLLDYCKVGSTQIKLLETDSAQILKEVLLNLRVAIAEAGAHVTHDPLPVLAADPVQLTQLFQNLIANAIKFRGPSPPCIHISAQSRGQSWEFAVSDNGIGIDKKHSERIFMIFQRLHRTEQYAGTGIGLAVCKKIVERHGGRIWLESESGSGSTFRFTIASGLRQAANHELRP